MRQGSITRSAPRRAWAWCQLTMLASEDDSRRLRRSATWIRPLPVAPPRARPPQTTVPTSTGSRSGADETFVIDSHEQVAGGSAACRFDHELTIGPDGRFVLIDPDPLVGAMHALEIPRRETE